MKKITILLMCVFSLWATGAFADAVYLKNGQVLKGKIKEKGSYYVLIHVDGIDQKIFDSEIDKLEEEGAFSSETSQQVKKTSIPESKEKLIKEYISVSGVRLAMEMNIHKIIETTPPNQLDQMNKIFNIDVVIENLVPLYAKYYSENELKSLISFFKSPEGKRMVEVTPKIMRDSIEILIAISQKMQK